MLVSGFNFPLCRGEKISPYKCSQINYFEGEIRIAFCTFYFTPPLSIVAMFWPSTLFFKNCTGLKSHTLPKEYRKSPRNLIVYPFGLGTQTIQAGNIFDWPAEKRKQNSATENLTFCPTCLCVLFTQKNNV